jgi:polysaccharide deactylase WbmS-like protein
VFQPTPLEAVRAYTVETSPLCFTTDIEWAPDWAIRTLFALADQYQIPLTPFLTHRSKFIDSELSATPSGDVGLHPNFLPGSTHGATVDEVIATTRALWPKAVSFRSHCFYDDTRMLRKMADKGFLYDSNLFAFLQPMLAPLRTVAGTVRLPVFWEDDVHSERRLPWDGQALRSAFETPGLKILNLHPMRVALNVPDEAFHESHRRLGSLVDVDPRAEAHRGRGTRTFVEELFEQLEKERRQAVRLRDLYEQAVDRGIGALDGPA